MKEHYDTERSADEARQRLPLKTLLEHRGYGPRESGEKWTAFTCPFCSKKKKAGVVERSGRQWFKCWHAECPSTSVKGKDEVGVLALLSNGSRRDAWEAWLREAGVWKEESRSPSVLPGSSSRRKLMPDPPPETPEEPEPSVEVVDVEQAEVAEAPQQEEAGVEAAGLESFSESDAVPTDNDPGVPGTVPDPQEAPEPDPQGPPIEIVLTDESLVGVQEVESQQLPPEDHMPGDPPPPPKRKPLQVFWESISLRADHRQDLASRRGLSDERITEAGFRSSERANRKVLESLHPEFEVDELVACGLWVEAGQGKPARPNSLYFGFGNSGKKDLSGKMIRDWVDPILIPYRLGSAPGELVYIRPHKDAPIGLEGHLYVPSGQPKFGSIAVITEGEFKADAIVDGGMAKVVAAAVPGISMVKEDSPGSHAILSELWAWLRRTGAKKVVVVFDNEDKSARVSDRRRRYDSEIWARYLAILAGRHGYTGLVGHLPDEWREGGTVVDGKRIGGKADWDSALASLRRRGQTQAQIRSAFSSVIQGATPPDDYNQTGLFDPEAEQIIKLGVARKFYRQKLARGGHREIKISAKLLAAFDAVSGKSKTQGAGNEDDESSRVGLVRKLARAYRESVGRYYVLKPCVTNANASWWHAKLKSARNSENHDAAYMAERVLEGIPFLKSDFVLDPLYVVHRADGMVHRRVRLRNVHSEDRVVNLGGEIHSPVKFREACIQFGGFSWGGNENDLNALREDMNHALVGRAVSEVAAYGWHPTNHMWMFADGAITSTGEVLVADEDGIIWSDGHGYQMSEVDQEGEGFRMGHPKILPGRGLRRDGNGGYTMGSGDDEPGAIQELASEMMQAIFNAVGGPDAWLAIGMTVGFAVAPEIYDRHQWSAGLWITGQKGSGKSTIARVLMRIFGFACDSGLNLTNSTAPGLLIAAQQLRHLPLWLDDYRPDLPPSIGPVLRAFYNRETGTKKQYSGLRRMVQTNAIVVGEHTASDSATRQRYVHVHMSEERRKHNDLEWIEKTMPVLFTLGRHILRNRTQFSERFWRAYNGFIERPELKKMQERTKLMHAVGCAAAEAFMGLFGLPMEWVEMLIKTTIGVAMDGDETVRAEANINVFFHEMVTAFNRGFLTHESGGIRRFFNVQVAGPDPNCPDWTRYELMIDGSSVHALLRERLRAQGRSMPIELQDLRQQMAAQPYWRKPYKTRLRNGSTCPANVWVIDVDSHPLGRLPVDEEQMDAARAESEALAKQELESRNMTPISSWEIQKEAMRLFNDPRRGELFLIVDAVLEAKKSNNSNQE